jgi:hypothetical protein
VARKRKAWTVFAADPGERTGVALVKVAADFNPETATPETFTILDQSVFTVRECGAFLKSWIKQADLVAYETWRLYANYAMAMIGNDMQPSQVVGMIRYVAWECGRKIVSNGAEVKKPAVARMPDWLLVHMAKSSEQHDQDAIMHAWFVAMNRYYQEQTNA